MSLKFVLVALLIHVESKAESIEDTSNPFSYSNTNAVNFNDIFSYTSSLVGGETAIAPDVKEDEFSLHIMPTHQIVDLNKSPPPRYVKNYQPPPKYIKNPKLLNKRKDEIFPSEITKETDVNTSFESTTIQRIFPSWMTSPTSSTSTTSTPIPSTSTTTTTTSTTTERIEELETSTRTFMMVSTTRDPNRERGILDLLFPAKRVKTFKTMFDAFRNILSHTFKR